MASFIDKLTHYNNAAYPALWIQTFEEGRVSKEIVANMSRKASANDPGCKVYEWDSLTGLTDKSATGAKTGFKDSEDPLKLFDAIKKISETDAAEHLYILKDFHLQFDVPLRRIQYIRAFKNILSLMKSRRSTILFLGPVVKIPTELSKEIQLLDYSLPDEANINTRLDHIFNVVNDSKKAKDKLDLPNDVRDLAIDAAKGMTEAEVENAFALAIVENKQFNMPFVKSVFGEKIQQIKKGGMLNHIESNVSFDNVGGLDGIKDWIKTRKNAFSKEAREYGLPFPKGLVLAGIAGCGKTLISRAIANEFNFPLFQLDVGSLFSKYVGETEGNFIQMVKTVDSIGRCVLLIDEVEKYMNSGATSGSGDSGTSSRSFGTLLSWLSDRSSPAFVVCTSNNHTILPPELTRKGRFDELFWIDLPSPTERRDVLNVVIKKYKRDAKKFDIDELIVHTDGYSGAEIDNAFKDAMFNAFSVKEEVSQKHVLKELSATQPLSKSNADALEAMRLKSKGKLRDASQAKLLTYAEMRSVKA